MKIISNIAILLISLIFIWVGGFGLFSAFAILAKPQSPQIKTDAIVVLTGGGNRIEEGLALFAARKSKNLFISGVHKDVIKNDVTAMWRGKAELPPCCITLGYQATTTEENAVEARNWILNSNIKTVRLVTGNYHIARSLLEFQHMVPGIKVYANPVIQPELGPKNKRFWLLLVIEYHKTIYRSLQLLFNDRPAQE